ncbi:MAG: hypothetical protein V1753_02955 [Pseudomonadota bacterium]
MAKVLLYFIFILFLLCACAGHNSSPGAVVVLAMDSIVTRNTDLFIRSSCMPAHDTAQAFQKMDDTAKRFAIEPNSHISIGRTFKKENNMEADVFFNVTKGEKRRQFLMKAKKENGEWFAVLDSLQMSDKPLW